jgi:hypothetical protein
MLNEGFWDALMTNLKTRGLSAMSKLGSKNAEGKLDAQMLATTMYDKYKKYLGQTGGYKDYQTLANFLVNEIGFDKKFVINAIKNNSSEKENNTKTNDDNELENKPDNSENKPSEEIKKTEPKFTDNQVKQPDKGPQERNYSTLEHLKKQNYTDKQKMLIARELQELMLKGKK